MRFWNRTERPTIRRLSPIVSFSLLFALLTFGGCAAQDDPLEGKAFLLTEANGIDDLNAAPLRLEFVDGNIGVSGGCNLIGGSYRLGDGRLQTEELMQTEMACENSRMAQDAAIIDLLRNNPSFELEDSTLTLIAGERRTSWTQTELLAN
jgi:heat shock protein HslJ